MANRETPEEQFIREELEGLLETDERLVGYSKGYIGPGGAGVTAAFGLIGEAIASPFRKWYHIGLTDKRLVLVPKGRRDETTSYSLADVLSLAYVRKGGWISSTTVPGILRLQLDSETLEIKAKGKHWWKHAEEMAAAFNQR
jgi:hypothetical protein